MDLTRSLWKWRPDYWVPKCNWMAGCRENNNQI